MKILLNIFLGICAAGCVLALLFQGFLFPALSPGLSLALRIGLGIFAQWLMRNLAVHPAAKAIPTIAAAIVAVWGLFLLLTSPSWLGATVQDFLADYASFGIGCLAVWILSWLLPRLIRFARQLIRELRRRKENSTPPEDYAKKKRKVTKR